MTNEEILESLANEIHFYAVHLVAQEGNSILVENNIDRKTGQIINHLINRCVDEIDE